MIKIAILFAKMAFFSASNGSTTNLTDWWIDVGDQIKTVMANKTLCSFCIARKTILGQEKIYNGF